MSLLAAALLWSLSLPQAHSAETAPAVARAS